MPEFLAETYAPRDAPAPVAPRPGAPVRFLGAVLVPDEETCFWLYQAPSADAVRAAMTSARLRPERITPAVSIRPSDPALSPRATPIATSSPVPDGISCRPPRIRRSGDA